jgi:methyl-accepting chemotaxis protein
MKIRLGVQISIVLALPVGLFVAAAALVYVNFTSVEMQNRRSADLDAVSQRALGIQLDVTRARFGVRGLLLTLDRANARAVKRALDALDDDVAFVLARRRLDPRLTASTENLSSVVDLFERGTRRSVDEVLANPDKMLAGYRSLRSSVLRGDAPLIQATMADGRTIDASISTLVDAASALAADAQGRNAAIIRRTRVSLFVATLAAIALSAVLASVFVRRLSRRVGSITERQREIVDVDLLALRGVVNALASGDLTARFESRRPLVPEHGSDELTDLTASYNGLARGFHEIGEALSDSLRSLRELVAGVKLCATGVSQASSEVALATAESARAVEAIATMVEQVAERSHLQAESIGSAGTAIEELSRAADQIASGAHDQSRSIQLAVDVTRDMERQIEAVDLSGTTLAQETRSARAETSSGNDAIGETIAAMIAFQRDAEQAAGAMAELETQSAAVEAIVGTIEGIADQTNLLALNAAIEAARAGEHGRGFAVVADEVRKLAESATLATREIGGILTAIRQGTLRAAHAMRESTVSMSRGRDIAERTKVSLGSVADSMASASAVAEDLVARSNRMRESSATFSSTIASVSAVVDENASAANELRTTAHLVMTAVVPVSTMAKEQADAARGAASATAELAAGVQQIDASTRSLREQSSELAGLTNAFRTETSDRVGASTVLALANA